MNDSARIWRNDLLLDRTRWPVVRTLQLLLESRQFAEGTANEPQAFALELNQLVSNGGDTETLRQLVSAGLVEHLVETTRPKGKCRCFEVAASALFDRRSCFVLADTELASTRAILSVEAEMPAVSCEATGDNDSSVGPRLTPRWETARRRLWACRLMIHQFPRQAVNLRRLLAAWGEDDWVEWIDNPFGETVKASAAKQLRDAVYGLNRCQSPQLLRFHFETCDDGEGAWWEWASSRITADPNRG